MHMPVGASSLGYSRTTVFAAKPSRAATPVRFSRMQSPGPAGAGGGQVGDVGQRHHRAGHAVHAPAVDCAALLCAPAAERGPWLARHHGVDSHLRNPGLGRRHYMCWRLAVTTANLVDFCDFPSSANTTSRASVPATIVWTKVLPACSSKFHRSHKDLKYRKRIHCAVTTHSR